jgi:hypothetical protein
MVDTDSATCDASSSARKLNVLIRTLTNRTILPGDEQHHQIFNLKITIEIIYMLSQRRAKQKLTRTKTTYQYQH